MKMCQGEPVAILAQVISCRNVRCVFPVNGRFWFCLVQVSTTQFCSFSLVLMASVDVGSVSNYGFPDVLALISKEWSPLDRCSVQRAPIYFVTTRAWIRRF